MPSKRPWICTAANRGDLDEVMALLAADPDLAHAVDHNNWTPLHFAAAGRRVDVAKLLLSRGADPNARGNGGEAPIHLADWCEVVKVLLDAGADPHLKDRSGFTAFSWAMREGNLETARLVAPAGVIVAENFGRG